MQTKLWQRPNVCNKVHNGAVQELACDGKTGEIVSRGMEIGWKSGWKAARSPTYVRASEFLLLFATLSMSAQRKMLSNFSIRIIIHYILITSAMIASAYCNISIEVSNQMLCFMQKYPLSARFF